MGISDGMFTGDLQRRVTELERIVRNLTSGRRLEDASVSRGGATWRGGTITSFDQLGRLIFEVDSDEPSIFMREELIANIVEAIIASPSGRNLSAAILADRITTSADAGHGTKTVGDGFGDLDGADAGPEVQGTVSDAGVALVFLSSLVYSFSNPFGSTNADGYVSVGISGASSASPSVATSLRNDLTSGEGFNSLYLRASLLVPFTGLSPGEHKFEMKYQATGVAGEQVSFQDRSITVITL